MNDKLLQSWVKEYTKDLLSWALHKVSDRATAEDLVQDTFLVAAEKLLLFRNDSSPKTWLFSILNNKIAEQYRSKSKFTKVTISSGGTLNDFFDEEGNWKKNIVASEWESVEPNLFDNHAFIESFQKCLDNLPIEWNRCIILKYLEQKEATLICQEVGISPTNYWQIVHRAKLQLRECLEKNWFSKHRE